MTAVRTTALLLAGLGLPPSTSAQLPEQLQRASMVSPGPVEAEMRNVCYRVDDRVTLHIRHLRGFLLPTLDTAPPWFEDPGSFRIVLDTADISIRGASLSGLLNDYVFDYKGSPLGGLEVVIAEGGIGLSGRLTRGVHIPFSIEAEVGRTADGRIRLRPRSIRVVGLSVQGLMERLDLELERVLAVRKDAGLAIDGNDVLIDPAALLPPPRIEGRLVALELREDELRQNFTAKAPRGSVPALQPGQPEARNYMFFQGSVLRFGKLTMLAADLQIIDADPGDAFDFHLRRMNRQLVAGFTLNQPDFGLVTVMPDYGSLPGGSGQAGCDAPRGPDP